MKERKKIANVLFLLWTSIFLLGGSALVNMFAKKEDLDLNYMEIFTSGLIGIVCGIIIAGLILFWYKKRKSRVPLLDERTWVVMRKYLLGVLYFIFVVSGVMVGVLYFSGIETISVGAIAIYICILFIITSIGAILVWKVL